MQTYYDDFGTSGEWKIHLTMRNSFLLSKGNNEKAVMNSKNHNREMFGVHTDEIITGECFEN